MKPKLKPNIEKFLITLSYLQNLIEKKPEIVNDYLIKSQLTEIELGIAPLDLFKIISGTIELIIEIPEYKFSNLISVEEYSAKADSSIKYITANYLDVPNNGLSPKEKKYIITGLKDFYLSTENNLIPFNQYNSTKHDRIAYSVLASAFFVFALTLIVSFIAKGWGKPEVLGKIKKITPKPIVLRSRNSIVDLSEYLKISVPKKNEVKANSKNNKLLNVYNIFKTIEKDMHLDNKALDTHHIQTIFNEVAVLMPKLSAHRRQILTGYIALNFGIINERDYKPATSSYNSLNNFLNTRVKGVVPKT